MPTEEQQLVERLRAVDDELARLAADTITRLVEERDEARETSRNLNRQLQSSWREAYRSAKVYIRNLHGEWSARRLRTLSRARKALGARYPDDAGVLVDELAERVSVRARTADAKVAELTEALKQIVADYDACSGAEPSLSVLHRSIDVDGRRALEASK